MSDLVGNPGDRLLFGVNIFQTDKNLLFYHFVFWGCFFFRKYIFGTKYLYI